MPSFGMPDFLHATFLVFLVMCLAASVNTDLGMPHFCLATSANAEFVHVEFGHARLGNFGLATSVNAEFGNAGFWYSREGLAASANAQVVNAEVGLEGHFVHSEKGMGSHGMALGRHGIGAAWHWGSMTLGQHGIGAAWHWGSMAL
jgi:hypothetical protein